MSSLYQRKDSGFWWIEYVDAAGEKRQKSTKLRRGSKAETRKAREVQREMTSRELERSERDLGELWAAWVPRFLAQRYGGAGDDLTRRRYLAAWRNLEAFLRAKRIEVPRQLNRQQVRDFIAWRMKGARELGIHKGAKNTALLEVKLLGLLMAEAIESGFATSNPCLKLGIGRDEAKAKPQILPAEHALITRSLKKEPEWMRVSYLIAYWQGCRFSETCLPLRDVDLARNVIGFRTKGNKQTLAEVPLCRQLRPLFRRLLREKRERTFELPEKMSGKHWWSFFRRIGLGHLCFHCTRVTFITRCYERGIAEPDVMRLALHASTTVHRVYPRLPAASPHLQEIMKRASAR